MTWTHAQESELRRLLRRAVLRDAYTAYACAGQNSFHSAEYARSAAPKGRGPISVYRCPKCHLWHVGSHVGRKARNQSPRIPSREGMPIQPQDDEFNPRSAA